MCATVATSQTFEVDGINYNITDKTAKSVEVASNTNYSGDVIIPSTVNYNDVTYSVTSIGSSAFRSRTGLTSITIPNSVRSIGSRAFYGCTGLTSITIPNSVTSIGDWAFYGCTGLTSITIPNSVTSIGHGAFSSTAWYENQTDGVVYVSNVCYSYKGEMPANTSITIKDGTLVIADYAFYGCTGLTSIEIPGSVTSIGISAFEDCTGLTNITIPNSVRSIGYDVFYSCTGLINIVVDEGNSTYDSRDNCNAIIETATNKLIAGCRNTVIPNSVTSIGRLAFSGCTGLTSVTIPNSVTSIGDWAFYGCTGLTSITIPNSVTSIGELAFQYCSGLTSVTIGNGVTSIGDRAFYSCTGLTNVAIGNGITSIEENAFEKCTGLQTVNISDIASWCSINFANEYSNPLPLAGNLHLNGEKVTELIIPDNVTKIPHYAFMGCTNIESVTIGNKMTTIEEDAFKDCSGLRAVNINDITSWCSISFENEYSNPLSSAGDLYLNGEKVTKLIIPENVTTIAGFAFWSCTSLESLVIGKNVTNIGYEAFCRCSSLTELDIQGAPYLEQAAFSRTGMEEINLPEGITNIHNWGFDSSPNLKSFVIPSTVTSLGHYIFQCCDSLECVISRIPAEELFEAPYAFLGMEAPNCILYVPAGAKEKYETTEGWGEMFAEVREYDEATGIDEPECLNVDIEIVYDLQGRRVKNPGNGIYIINGKKVFVK